MTLYPAKAINELPEWFKLLAIGFLTGVVIGVLGGAFVYAPLMTSFEIGGGEMFQGKVLAVYKVIGIAFGALIGGAAGLLTGVGWWWLERTAAQPNGDAAELKASPDPGRIQTL